MRALGTIDRVALARVACQELCFAADVLAAKVQGAIKQRIADDDLGLGNVVGGSLIRMLGKDLEPVDLSREEVMGAFMQDMDVWYREVPTDTEMCGYGSVDIRSVNANPYGVPY